MRNDQILQIAISKNLRKEQIGENCKSALSVVHQCIRAVNITEQTEEEKKERLLHHLRGFWHGTDKIDGCKREQIQRITTFAFGIKNERERCLSAEIRSLTFQELYLYYCYLERIANGDPYFSQFLWENYKEKQSKSIVRKRLEEQQKQKLQEEEEQRKLEEMGEEERWWYEISQKQQDIFYFQKLVSEEKYKGEERITVARLLKKYWQEVGKWEGNKVSKKQMEKIGKIKEILGGND